MDPELLDRLRALAEGKAPKANGSGVAIVLPLDADDAEALALEDGLPPDELHCTLAYLGSGDAVTDAQVEAAKEVLAAWAEGRAPIPARVGCIGRFPGSEDEGDPVYLPVDAPRLTLERPALLRALRDAEAPAKGDHGFNAHVTVSYVPVEDDLPVQRVEPREVKFTRVELWAKGKHFTYPLESDYDTPEKARPDGPKTETHAMRPDVLQEMMRLASTPVAHLAEAGAPKSGDGAGGPPASPLGSHRGMKMIFGTWRELKNGGAPASTPKQHATAATFHRARSSAAYGKYREHAHAAQEHEKKGAADDAQKHKELAGLYKTASDFHLAHAKHHQTKAPATS